MTLVFNTLVKNLWDVQAEIGLLRSRSWNMTQQLVIQVWAVNRTAVLDSCLWIGILWQTKGVTRDSAGVATSVGFSVEQTNYPDEVK